MHDNRNPLDGFITVKSSSLLYCNCNIVIKSTSSNINEILLTWLVGVLRFPVNTSLELTLTL